MKVPRFTPSDADRHRCYHCGQRVVDHAPDEDGARCNREAVRQMREITAPPAEAQAQGGGEVCEVCDGGPGNDGPCLCGLNAPPSAPVGALKDAALIAGWEAKANAIEREEASRRSDIDFGKVLQLRECAQELRSRAEAAALAQQPAAVDGALAARVLHEYVRRCIDHADDDAPVELRVEAMQAALTTALAAQPGGAE